MKLRTFTTACAGVATIALCVAAHTAAGDPPHQVDYTPKAYGPVENNVVLGQQDGWDIATFKKGGFLYKGLEAACKNVMGNTVLDNRFAQTPSWFGNPDIADDYAIRATAKAYRKALTNVVGKRIERYVPDVACVAEFQAVRDLVLFPIIDEHNVARLLEAIRGRIDKQLQAPIGTWLASGAWQQNGEDDDEDVTMIGTDDSYRMLFNLGKRRNRDAVDQYIRDHSSEPLAMTQQEMDFLNDSLVRDGWSTAAAKKRVAQRNATAARKLVDELVRLQRQWFVVRFATGYGMSWSEQKQVLGGARVASRKLDGVTDFDGGMGPIQYVLKYNGVAVATIGSGERDFDRISMMGKDLELVSIIKEYVNVDGYWAPEVPSLWHRDQMFHSEIALFSPRFAVDYTGKALPPDASKDVPMKDVAGDD